MPPGRQAGGQAGRQAQAVLAGRHRRMHCLRLAAAWQTAPVGQQGQSLQAGQRAKHIVAAASNGCCRDAEAVQAREPANLHVAVGTQSRSNRVGSAGGGSSSGGGSDGSSGAAAAAAPRTPARHEPLCMHPLTCLGWQHHSLKLPEVQSREAGRQRGGGGHRQHALQLQPLQRREAAQRARQQRHLSLRGEVQGAEARQRCRPVAQRQGNVPPGASSTGQNKRRSSARAGMVG